MRCSCETNSRQRNLDAEYNYVAIISYAHFSSITRFLPHQQLLWAPVPPWREKAFSRATKFLTQLNGKHWFLIFTRHPQHTNKEIVHSNSEFFWTHLPCYKRLALYNNSQSIACSLCHEEDSNDHFLRLTPLRSHPTSITLLQKLTTNFRKKYLPAILTSLLLSILHPAKPEPHPAHVTLPSNLHSDYEKIFQEKEALGWSHFVRGRIVKSWMPFLKKLTAYNVILEDIPYDIRCQSAWKNLFKYITGI